MSDGYILAEVVVESALATALNQVEAAIGAETIDQLLAVALSNESDARRVEFANWLREHDLPQIVRSYPRTPEETPCYSIVLDPEQQEQFVGDSAGEGGSATLDGTYPEDGESWTSTIGVVAYAENADLALWMYHLAKFLISRQRQAMTDDFEMNVSLSGRDFGFDPRFLAASVFVYRRALMVTARYVQRHSAEIEWAEEIVETGTAPEVVDE